MINYNSIYQRLPMINAAKAGQTITFEFGVWNSFPKSFMDLNFGWYGPAKMAKLVEADGGLAPGRKYWNRPMHAVDESICDKNE